jgi:hypothetical protein
MSLVPAAAAAPGGRDRLPGPDGTVPGGHRARPVTRTRRDCHHGDSVTHDPMIVTAWALLAKRAQAAAVTMILTT